MKFYENLSKLIRKKRLQGTYIGDGEREIMAWSHNWNMFSLSDRRVTLLPPWELPYKKEGVASRNFGKRCKTLTETNKKTEL